MRTSAGKMRVNTSPVAVSSSDIPVYIPLERFYTPDDLDGFFAELKAHSLPEIEVRIRKRKYTYYNIACAYDTEATTMLLYKVYIAWQYAWMFSIDGVVILGRTWDDFYVFIDRLREELDLSEEHKRRIIIYVHNLPYEFQFLRKRYKWLQIFATENRKPVYTIMDGIEFRCSYKMTNLSLDALQLYKYTETMDTHRAISKQTGALDYTIIRHSGTPLSKQETRYCIYDVIKLGAYIQEQIETEGRVTDIPLTSTGYARREMRRNCLSNDYANDKYRKMIKALTIKDSIEYSMYRACYSGGSTAVNPAYAEMTLSHVGSYDIASSYPAVMVMCKYPMGAPKRVHYDNAADFERDLQLPNRLYAFRVRFWGLRPADSPEFEHPISASKCQGNGIKKWNGRVISADYLQTAMTSVDWETVCEYYTWDSYEVTECYMWTAGYLPTDFVRTVLEYYARKTQLKGDKSQIVYYDHSKQLLNSFYGMAGTDPVRTEVVYDLEANEWPDASDFAFTDPDDEEYYDAGFYEDQAIEEALRKIAGQRDRFLYPWWAVFITAHARRRLQRMIRACGIDYIYSDTDSVKILHPELHQKDIDAANDEVRIKMEAAMRHHGFALDAWRPKTPDQYDGEGKLVKKGKEKPLGYWEYEGYYQKFRALRSKCYAYRKKGKITVTIAGVSKRKGSKYFQTHRGCDGDHLSLLEPGLVIPKEYSGRLIHVYGDTEIGGTVTDYLGNVGSYHEYSYVALYSTEYNLSMGEEMISYIYGARYAADERA